ncbi:MAG: hypothetical protein Q8L90_19550, partial [Bacteroidota bacterium]|nr:hypothetical protein [Bacteroidota bacterium]
MKKIAFISLIISAFTQITIAQTKLLTMDDAIIKQKTTLAPAKLKQLMWVKGENGYSYVDTKDSIDFLILGKAESANKPLKTLVSMVEINDGLGNLRFKSLKTFPQIQWKTSDIFTFEAEKNLFAYDLK